MGTHFNIYSYTYSKPYSYTYANAMHRQMYTDTETASYSSTAPVAIIEEEESHCSICFLICSICNQDAYLLC